MNIGRVLVALLLGVGTLATLAGGAPFYSRLLYLGLLMAGGAT
jgi:hypothetical protein